MNHERIASFLCGGVFVALWIFLVDYDPARTPELWDPPTSRAAASVSAREWKPVGATAERSAQAPFAARPRALRRMIVTAYCPGPCCCGPFADGVTASKLPVTENGGRFVAGPPSMGFGTMIRVPGYAGDWVPVLDRGEKITEGKLDVFFPTHRAALEWGRKTLTVEILQ